MKRLKTFLKYLLWLVAFWILSDFLINVGINSTYKNIEALSNNSQIEIYQAEATAVNGRIKGIVRNSATNNIAQKYIKLELFSKRNVQIGTRYIEIGNLAPNDIMPLELYFKIDNVDSYKMEIVDEKGEEEDIELLPKDLSKGEILLGVLVIMMFW